MNKKNYGKATIGRSIGGYFVYLVSMILIVFLVKVLYSFLTAKLGFSFIILDAAVWVIIIAISSVVANKIISLFRIENAKVFSYFTILAAPCLIYVYYYSTVAAAVFTYANGYILSPFQFGSVIELIKLMFSQGPDISRRASSSFTLPGFINYIFALIVAISFIFPKGKFNVKNGIYMDGVKVNFIGHDLFTRGKIDEETLHNTDAVYKVERSEIDNGNVAYNGNYYTLYIADDYTHKFYILLENKYQNKKGKVTIKFEDHSNYYYSIHSGVNELSSKCQNISVLQQEIEQLLPPIQEESDK